MKKVLAFDLGSSNGWAIKDEYENGHLCWDFDMIMKEVQIGIEKAGKIDSIGVDAWGADFGILDEKGELLTMLVHYRERRTEGMIEKAQQQLSAKELLQMCVAIRLMLQTPCIRFFH